MRWCPKRRLKKRRLISIECDNITTSTHVGLKGYHLGKASEFTVTDISMALRPQLNNATDWTGEMAFKLLENIPLDKKADF